MDVGLAVGRGHADGGVLQHTAQAAHRVTLEVGQVDHEVVACQVVAHDVVLDVLAVAHGNLHLAFLVHQVHDEQRVEAVLVYRLPVRLKRVALAAVGRIALHDGAVHLVHQVLDERRPEVVGVARLARRYFHRHASLCRHAQGLVDSHQRLRADFPRHVHFALRHGCRRQQHHHGRKKHLLHTVFIFFVKHLRKFSAAKLQKISHTMVFSNVKLTLLRSFSQPPPVRRLCLDAVPIR